MVAALVVALVVLGVAGWIFVTTTRLTRLGARVDAAAARLDAELVRRAAAAQTLVDSFGPRSPAAGDQPPAPDLDVWSACRRALLASGDDRESAENDLTRALTTLPAGGGEQQRRDLADASIRVGLARRFYNDAVRDARSLRTGRLTRVLRLAAYQDPPAFFEIADYRSTTGAEDAARVPSTAAPGRARPDAHVVPKGSPR